MFPLNNLARKELTNMPMIQIERGHVRVEFLKAKKQT